MISPRQPRQGPATSAARTARENVPSTRPSVPGGDDAVPAERAVAPVHDPSFKPSLRRDVQFFRGEQANVVVVLDPRPGKRHKLTELECIPAQERDAPYPRAALPERPRLYLGTVTREQVEKFLVQFAALGLIENMPAHGVPALPQPRVTDHER